MDSSPFSKLSAELRNSIYHFATVAVKPIVVRRPNEIQAKGQHCRYSSFGLLHSCQQIRRESSQLYFSSNCFQFGVKIWSTDDSCISHIKWVFEWLDMLSPENCQALTTVVLDLGEYLEGFGPNCSLLPRKREVTNRRIQELAPSIASLTRRVRPTALAITSIWRMRQSEGVEKEEREVNMWLTTFRLFTQGPVSAASSWIYNSKIDNIFTAHLVGQARAVLVSLTDKIWQYCLIYGSPNLTATDLNLGRHALRLAFERIDDKPASRAMALMPDEVRGYPIPSELYIEANNHIEDFTSWIIEGS